MEIEIYFNKKHINSTTKTQVNPTNTPRVFRVELTRNDHFYILLTWNTCGTFVGKIILTKLK